jgi:hypothetical protein
MGDEFMKNKVENEINYKINDIRSIIDCSVNHVIEVFKDISIDDAMSIFKENIDIVMAIVEGNGSMLLIDKDILLERVLKKRM